METHDTMCVCNCVLLVSQELIFTEMHINNNSMKESIQWLQTVVYELIFTVKSYLFPLREYISIQQKNTSSVQLPAVISEVKINEGKGQKKNKSQTKVNHVNNR